MPPAIKTALGADPMQENGIAAISAGDEGRRGQFHIDRLASPRPRLRRPEFRYSHVKTSLFRIVLEYIG